MNNSLVRERQGALLLRVRACPGSTRQGIRGLHGNAIKVAVQAAPEHGKANAAIAGVLAGAFGLRSSQVALESGDGSRDKCFSLTGLTVSAFEEKLERLLSEKKGA